MARIPRHVLRALGVIAMMTGASGYTCKTTVVYGKDNYGPGVSDEAVRASTPFEIGTYNAIIAFDSAHCVKMCCEQTECALVVFNEIEAVCYLKAADALFPHHVVEAEGINTLTISSREGVAEPLALEPKRCDNKRGLAYGFKDTRDIYALKNGLSWWYDWSPGVLLDRVLQASLAQGSEYVPMIWGQDDLTEERLRHLDWVGSSSSFLLGFNEPNYLFQSNLGPAKAAELWSQVGAVADALNLSMVSPAVNFCFGQCNEEDPYRWLDDFFQECLKIEGGCRVSHLAIHTYSCQVKYINKHVHRYLKYGLPIWLTEFACGYEDNVANEAGQARLLSDSITYLEMHPSIYRYAWFTGRASAQDGIVASDLLAGTGGLTAVGKVFVEKYANLQHCAVFGGEAPGFESTSQPDLGHASGTVLDVDPHATAITSVVIDNVGGSGYYDKVTGMVDGTGLSCTSFSDSCIKQEVCVEGDLVPFDEVSVAFRGPMNLHRMAWYEGEADAALRRTSSWSPDSEENMVFMNNRGGATGCSGEWSTCGGNAQSFADATGSWCAPEPTHFAGELKSDNEINIMTSWECASVEQCGFYRDVGMRGWTGGADGTKVFVFEVDMPHCSEDECMYDRPAVWALNAQTLRTAQYGCNCRGFGVNGGCGEFDILEAIIDNPYGDMLFVHVFDFKGTAGPGADKYFERPSRPKTYAAVFRGGRESYLQVAAMDSWDFDSPSMSRSLLDLMLGATTEKHSIYEVKSRIAPNGCSEAPTPSDIKTNAPGGNVPAQGSLMPETTSPGTPQVSEQPAVRTGLAEGFEYVGCFGDKQPFARRDMALLSRRRFKRNKPALCASRCMKMTGSTFFGVQNGKLCWCGGMGDSGPGSYGVASNCDKACPGDGEVACGGKMASSVYVLPVTHIYMGCFLDVEGDRDMLLVPKTVSDYLTPAVCAAYCASVEGALFFGVQNGRHCFCGDSFGRHGASPNGCVDPCAGDRNQICGGADTNSVYSLDNIPRDIVVRGEPNDDDDQGGDDDGEFSIKDVSGMSRVDSAADNKNNPATRGEYLGCFRDSSEDPLLDGIKVYDSERLTAESCCALCKGQGFTLCGVEWSIICFCGGTEDDSRADVLDGAFELDSQECYLDCPGNRAEEGQTCGGQDAVQIWKL